MESLKAAATRGGSGLPDLRQADGHSGQPLRRVHLVFGLPRLQDYRAARKRKLSMKPCPNCGKRRWRSVSGRFGQFIACTNYPECKTTKQPASAKIDVPCPKCGGEVVQKRSKKGATFYGCGNYPKCDFVAWGKPIGRACPKCEQPLMENTMRGGRVVGIKCMGENCDYKEALPVKAAEIAEGERELAAV